jgi:L-threonylcarbamoyladenylate synthase
MNEGPAAWKWGEELSILAKVLDQDGMLAIPTESSYGIAVDPLRAAAVRSLFELKGRPPEKPLPVVLGNLEHVALMGGDPEAPGLLELAALWPAPLTVLVPIAQAIPASAGRRVLAVRVPAHLRLRELLEDLGRPLTATSANPAGGSPVLDPSMLNSMLSSWSGTIVNDGPLPGGAASTIVQIGEEGYRVLRVGALSLSWLQNRVSRPVFSAAAAEIPADDSPHTP